MPIDSPENVYDVVVCGGGIHGAGVAQAATAAGYRVLVLEKTRLAAGTSSKSSKLIHGGLRYLESLEFSLVRESLLERELLLKLAPRLVQRRCFYIPIYPDTSRRPWFLRSGLSLYAVLSGFRRYTAFRTFRQGKWRNLDGLRTTGLQKVFQYWDAQTDDAQLTEAVMRSAQRLGATFLCPAEFSRAEVHSEGCDIGFQMGHQQHAVRCLAFVNAGGPWAGEICRRISPPAPAPRVDLVQGTHIELPGEIKKGCYYLEAPQDGRAVFVMPWKGRTLVGTTERMYQGRPEDVRATAEEIEYLLHVFHHYFPGRPRNVLADWAGLRVLPAAAEHEKAFTRSRETQMPVDDSRRPRVLSIFGGKLTGYRATAQKVLRKLRRTLPAKKPIADTARLMLTTQPSDDPPPLADQCD